MAIKVPGLIIPPLTPFTAQYMVDYDALRAEIDYIIEKCSPGAITAAGVEAQEYQYLGMDERKELIRKTVELTGNRCPVVVGVSHPSIKTVVELCKEAERVNAEAVQLLAPLRPFGGKPSGRQMVEYFKEAAKNTSLPIVCYLNAGPGADVPPETMVEIASIDSVKYFKESSRDMRRVGRLIEEIDHAGLARYFTTNEMLLPTLMLGGSGATMPPPLAAIAAGIVKAYTEGDFGRAAELQRKFHQFPGKWADLGLTPILKYAMGLLGIELGEPYPPFGGMSKSDTEGIRKMLDNIGLAAFAGRM